MITGATKGKVDAVWQKMWEGGITNPIEVISQLTYLMFMRQLDEKELEAERMEQVLGVPQPRIFPQVYRNAYGAQIDGEQMRWSRFKDKPAEEILDYVLPLSGRAQMPKVNKKALQGFSMPLPPLELQQEFADFAVRVDGLRSVAQQQIEKLQMLYDSLAQDYFG